MPTSCMFVPLFVMFVIWLCVASIDVFDFKKMVLIEKLLTCVLIISQCVCKTTCN